MKTLAKVFTILGIIGGAIFIYPLIVGLISLKKMKNATSKADIKVWAIINLIFCSLLGGIFMLLTKDADYAAVEAPAAE